MSRYIIFSVPPEIVVRHSLLEIAVIDVGRLIGHYRGQNFTVVLGSHEKAQTLELLRGHELGCVYMSNDAFAQWTSLYSPLLNEFMNLMDRYQYRKGHFKKIDELLTRESKKVFDLWNAIPHEKEYSTDLSSYFFLLWLGRGRIK